MVEGAVVLGCRNCRQFAIKGSDVWVSATAQELREALRKLAGHVVKDKEVVEEIIETPITDRRWVEMGSGYE